MTEEKLHKTVSKRTANTQKGRKHEIDIQRQTIQRRDDSEDEEGGFDNAQPNVNTKIP